MDIFGYNVLKSTCRGGPVCPPDDDFVIINTEIILAQDSLVPISYSYNDKISGTTMYILEVILKNSTTMPSDPIILDPSITYSADVSEWPQTIISKDIIIAKTEYSGGCSMIGLGSTAGFLLLGISFIGFILRIRNKPFSEK